MSALIAEQTLRETSRRLIDGSLSCEALAEDCIRQRQRFDPSLYAFHQFYDDRLRQCATQAQQRIELGQPAALCGLPYSIKNVFAATGYACYPGTRVPAPAQWQQDGEVVATLNQQQALLVGTTHASELAVGGLGVNEHWGTPRNPWDAASHRVPGGSSAGAAVSVLQGACGFALGTDTGGSVRVPASAAGIVGLKTTGGRWPLSGIVPLASRFDTVGVMARTVSDVAFVFEQIDAAFGRGVDQVASHSAVTLGELRFQRASPVCWQGLDAGIGEACENALARLRQAGAVFAADDTLFEQAANLRDRGPNTAAVECQRLLDQHLPGIRGKLSKHVAGFLEGALVVTDTMYHDRLQTILGWREKVARQLGDLDIIVAPTLRETPPLLATLDDPEQYAHYSDSLLHNTVLGSINGLCAITLPVGLDDCGIPVGLQLAAKAGSEPLLLHVALLVESVLGTTDDCCGYPPLLESLYNSATS